MFKPALLAVCRWPGLLAILLIPRSGPAADPEMGVVPRRAPVPAEARWTDCLIGYAELQTDLPGGRHGNVRTMRATLARADGTGQHPLASALADEPDAWTQFGGWSPDGAQAIISRGWESLENASWEEEHKSGRCG